MSKHSKHISRFLIAIYLNYNNCASRPYHLSEQLRVCLVNENCYNSAQPVINQHIFNICNSSLWPGSLAIN